ncbi:MAG: hypothetical protein GXO76_04980 [Calditrichaeota bacterium]|nr:hypothetical protein [Calditrichota bacterium]
MKPLLKNPKRVQKITVVKSAKESDKKGAKESETVFLAVPISISRKQSPTSGKNDIVTKGDKGPVKPHPSVKTGARTDWLISLGVKDAGKHGADKTLKTNAAQKAESLSVSQNKEPVILTEKSAGNLDGKTARGTSPKVPLNNTLSWMIVPVSEETKAHLPLASADQQSKTKSVETIETPAGKAKNTTKPKVAHSGKGAPGQAVDKPEYPVDREVRPGKVMAKERPESAPSSVLSIFGKDVPSKALLVSVEGPVTISGKNSVEFISTGDSRKPARIVIQEVEIQAGEGEKRWAKRLSQLMEKAHVVKVATDGFSPENSTVSQEVSGKKVLQNGESEKNAVPLTRSQKDGGQAQNSERKADLLAEKKVAESSLNPKNKRPHTSVLDQNSKPSVSEKSTFSGTSERGLHRVGLEKSENDPTQWALKRRSDDAKRPGTQEISDRFEEKTAASVSKKNVPMFVRKIQTPASEGTDPSQKSPRIQGKRSGENRESASGPGRPENSGNTAMEQRAPVNMAAHDQPLAQNNLLKQSRMATEHQVSSNADRTSGQKPDRNENVTSEKRDKNQVWPGTKNRPDATLNPSKKGAASHPILTPSDPVPENSRSGSGEAESVTGKKPPHGGSSDSLKKEALQKTEPAQKGPINHPISTTDLGRVETLSQRGKPAAPLFTQAGPSIPKEILNKLVQNTRLLIQRGGSAQMQIQLKPGNLGAIRLLVETVQNQITVKILVNKPKTQHLLEQHIQSLQQSLVQQGYKIEHIQVGLNVQSEPFQQGQAFQNQTQQGGDFRQGQSKNQFTESGSFLNQPNESQQQSRSRRFGYNSVEYVA